MLPACSAARRGVALPHSGPRGAAWRVGCWEGTWPGHGEEVGAPARGSSRRREDARTLPTAHAATRTPAQEDAAPPAEGGVTPRPPTPSRGHRRSQGLGSPVSQCRLPMGCPALERGVRRLGRGDGCLGCFAAAPGLGPPTASGCAGASPRLQLGLCPLPGQAQSSPSYKYPGAALPAAPGRGGCSNQTGFIAINPLGA